MLQVLDNTGFFHRDPSHYRVAEMSSVPATPLSPVAGGVGAAAGGGKQENVKVAIRVRPFNRREKEMGAKSVVEIGEDGKSITITDPSPVAQTSGAAAGAGGRSESNGGSSGNGKDAEAGKKTFFFDHVYGSETLQADFYTTTAKPIVEQSLKGYNGTIFAYGQVSVSKQRRKLQHFALVFFSSSSPLPFCLHFVSCALAVSFLVSPLVVFSLPLYIFFRPDRARRGQWSATKRTRASSP